MFLFAILDYEYYADNFKLESLEETLEDSRGLTLPASPDDSASQLDLIRHAIDCWYIQNKDQIRKHFDLLNDLKPARITDIVVKGRFAMIEITY